MEVEGGELLGHIEDQQGKFNLNNLITEGKVNLAQLAHFRRLLAILGLPDNLAYALADWIDADSEPQPQAGAEDEYYLQLHPPYLTANRPLIDIGELALVRGFNNDVIKRLRPYVSALPGFTSVNVNTAPAAVLAAVVNGLDLAVAQQLITQRDQVSYYRSTDDFLKRLPQNAEVATNDIGVSSSYFIATMRVTISGARAQGEALLARGSTGWPAILWRKYQ
jgi:general secretion pathway protein K